MTNDTLIKINTKISQILIIISGLILIMIIPALVRYYAYNISDNYSFYSLISFFVMLIIFIFYNAYLGLFLNVQIETIRFKVQLTPYQDNKTRYVKSLALVFVLIFFIILYYFFIR